jgi:hypothetical protein
MATAHVLPKARTVGLWLKARLASRLRRRGSYLRAWKLGILGFPRRDPERKRVAVDTNSGPVDRIGTTDMAKQAPKWPHNQCKLYSATLDRFEGERIWGTGEKDGVLRGLHAFGALYKVTGT